MNIGPCGGDTLQTNSITFMGNGQPMTEVPIPIPAASHLERVKPQAMKRVFRLQRIQWGVLNAYASHSAPSAPTLSAHS